jgi:NAD(P)-dependent dehydrogenase (short-subunit alcohol dehydrogenase family)
MELSGRSVVLTGVGREGQVGEAVARAFAEKGARVLLVDRMEEEARARSDTLLAAGLRSASLAADLSDVAAVPTPLPLCVREATSGRVHALVHLAGGFSASGPVADSDPAVWARQLTINLTTAYLTARAFMPLVRAAKGSMVFLRLRSGALPGARVSGSPPMRRPRARCSPSSRPSLKRSGTTGCVPTPLPRRRSEPPPTLPRWARDVAYVTREAVADVVVWLCSDAARSVTGQVVRVR